MNSELKLVIFEEKKILQELLELLDEQYKTVLAKDPIALDKATTNIENMGKKLAIIEIKRRNIIGEEDFKFVIENSEDVHIKAVYEEIKEMLKNLELQNSTNGTLLKQNLFFTNKMINIIKPTKNTGTYNSYGKVGR